MDSRQTNLYRRLTFSEATKMIKEGAISGVMIPKVSSLMDR
jgi:acetylglutamate kinase